MKKSVRITLKILSVLIWLAYIGVSLWRLTVELDYTHMYGTYWCLLAINYFIPAFLHECGHALFGLLSGVRAKINFKSIFSLLRPSSTEIIPKTDKKLKPRVIATASGGLVINFIFIVFGILAIVVPQIPVWLSGIAVYHLALFLVNVLPIEYSDGKTDALIIIELLKETDEAKVMLAVLSVQAQVLNGKPIAEVDEKLLFDLPQIQEDEPAFISLTELRAEYFAAKGDTENAQKYKSRFEQLKQEYLK